MKRPQRQRSQPSFPWLLPPIENAEIFAIQAVAKGIANDGQQRRAWDYIVNALCQTDRMTFWLDPLRNVSGVDGQRATDFAEGKRWVGVQLRRIERLRPDMSRELGLPPGREPEPQN